MREEAAGISNVRVEGKKEAAAINDTVEMIGAVNKGWGLKERYARP